MAADFSVRLLTLHNAMQKTIKRAILALQFLTVFSVKKYLQFNKGELKGATAFFPLAGAVQGLILVAANYALSRFIPASICAALIVLILALTNGALHLDGFADTVDGLAGGNAPDERLKIMRDCYVGAVGVVFLVLILLLKYLAIKELPDGIRYNAIFLFPVAGRWAVVPMACWAVPARKEDGLGSAFTGTSYQALFIATAITTALAFFLLGAYSLIILAALAVVTYLFTAFFKKRLGGVTGDVFGFQSECAEVIFLLMMLASKALR